MSEEKRITRRELFTLGWLREKNEEIKEPAQKIVAIGAGCTMCGLCVVNCKSKALRFSGEINLELEPSLCDACGDCLKDCPEKCIFLVAKDKETGKMVLVSDKFVHCHRCGNIIAPSRMLAKIKERLPEQDIQQLCPECKSQADTK